MEPQRDATRRPPDAPADDEQIDDTDADAPGRSLLDEDADAIEPNEPA